MGLLQALILIDKKLFRFRTGTEGSPKIWIIMIRTVEWTQSKMRDNVGNHDHKNKLNEQKNL